MIIASYNIRYARGPYLISGGLRRKLGLMSLAARPEHVARQISAAARAFTDGKLLPSVDVLALQEADMRTARTGGHHVAEELAAQLGMHWAHEAAGIPRGVKPVKRQWWLDFEEPIDLPWHECKWRPRLAMAATISVGPQDIRIFNAHVDPHAAVDGQLAQLEAIAAKSETTTLPTIVLGDFNTLSRQKCVETREFFEKLGYTTPFPTGTETWRTTVLKMHADWIFVRGVKIERWGVARPTGISDHWPIWAEVVVGA
jgi:endonuclease/exonuclease/phosphatase family metal-dependent hydrolase